MSDNVRLSGTVAAFVARPRDAEAAHRHADQDGIQAIPRGITHRDQHLLLIAEHGRMGWQRAFGYNRRALAEAAIGRFKRVIGDELHSRADRRQATEMTVGVLNRMLELGRPKSVRIA
jgi:hypothetical protein